MAKQPEVVDPNRDALEEEQRLIALEKKRKPLEFGGPEDFQLAQAMNHLKGLPVQVAKVKPETAGSSAVEKADKADKADKKK